MQNELNKYWCILLQHVMRSDDFQQLYSHGSLYINFYFDIQNMMQRNDEGRAVGIGEGRQQIRIENVKRNMPHATRWELLQNIFGQEWISNANVSGKIEIGKKPFNSVHSLLVIFHSKDRKHCRTLLQDLSNQYFSYLTYKSYRNLHLCLLFVNKSYILALEHWKSDVITISCV